jgi:hypothetical protein
MEEQYDQVTQDTEEHVVSMPTRKNRTHVSAMLLTVSCVMDLVLTLISIIFTGYYLIVAYHQWKMLTALIAVECSMLITDAIGIVGALMRKSKVRIVLGIVFVLLKIVWILVTVICMVFVLDDSANAMSPYSNTLQFFVALPLLCYTFWQLVQLLFGLYRIKTSIVAKSI